MKTSRPLLGALVGLMLTAPLGAVFFLFNRLLGLAFVPFDLFEWLSRVLPGPLVIFGIETMKNGLIAVGLSVARTSKTAEQILALIIYLAAGVVIAAVYFEALRGSRAAKDPQAGLILGAVVGVPLMLIVAGIETPAVPLIVNALYTLAAFLGWGWAMQWFQAKLVDEPAPAKPATAAEEEPVTVEQIDRRRFLLRAGAATAAITVVGAGLGSVISTGTGKSGQQSAASGPKITPTPVATRQPLPNMASNLEPASGTRPEYTPVKDHYRIDITLQYPEVDGASYALPVVGLVDAELNLTLDDIRKYPSIDQYVTLACISNGVGGDLIGTTRWTGVSLQRILADAKVQPAAKHLYIESSDGFFESVPLDTIMSDERVMLCYAWDGQPLTEEHGFPLRIYIPNHYGMKQPKWITNLELTEQEKPGYWVVRGWDHDAIMKATSVIDTVAVNDVYVDDGGQKRVPVGGIAHAGSRSVSKVQVKVDDGPWADAELRKPLSDLAWVIWRYDWPVQPGNHTFAVRCVDGDGNPQIETPVDVFPSGATGIDTVKGSL